MQASDALDMYGRLMSKEKLRDDAVLELAGLLDIDVAEVRSWSMNCLKGACIEAVAKEMTLHCANVIFDLQAAVEFYDNELHSPKGTNKQRQLRKARENTVKALKHQLHQYSSVVEGATLPPETKEHIMLSEGTLSTSYVRSVLDHLETTWDIHPIRNELSSMLHEQRVAVKELVRQRKRRRRAEEEFSHLGFELKHVVRYYNSRLRIVSKQAARLLTIIQKMVCDAGDSPPIERTQNFQQLLDAVNQTEFKVLLNDDITQMNNAALVAFAQGTVQQMSDYIRDIAHRRKQLLNALKKANIFSRYPSLISYQLFEVNVNLSEFCMNEDCEGAAETHVYEDADDNHADYVNDSDDSSSSDDDDDDDVLNLDRLLALGLQAWNEENE